MNTNGRRLCKHAAGWLTGIMVLSSACGTTAMANGVMLVESASVADVHAEADETSPVLITLSGTQAVVLGHEEDWTKVQVGGITGWVESEHLTNGSDTTQDIVPDSPEATEAAGNTEEQIEQTEEKQEVSGEKQNAADESAAKMPEESQTAAGQQTAEATKKAEEDTLRKTAEEQKAAQETAGKAAAAAQKAAAEAQKAAEEAAQKAAAQAQKAAEEAAQKAAAQARKAAEEAAQKAAEEAQRAAEEAARKAAEEAQAAAVQAAQQAVIAQAGVTSQDVELLAALIQCEAGGESYVGQVAVGNVVMNRVEAAGHPGSIPDVIYAAGQFSPVRNGTLSRTLSTGNISPSCRQAAVEAIAGSAPVGDKLYFRRANGRSGQIIGNHVFY
nr:cell wall hydrolase [uncultured Eisenbergiella sp.]